MIEIMCRDDSVTPEMLERVADYIRAVIDDDVEILYPEDHRAMVFWSPGDVATAIKETGSATLDADDMDLCNTLLETIEPEIHRSMLEAGRDMLNRYILDVDDGAADDDLNDKN